MTYHMIVMAAASLICCGAFAEAPAPDPVRKVDLHAVLETGTVPPAGDAASSGQPDGAALKVFAQHGYAAVIDLRTESEDRGIDEAAIVEGLGMDYISLPIAGAAAINFDNAEKLGWFLDRYEGPVLVHCGSGNRVGALLALRSKLQGADDESAIDVGKAGGLTRLEPRVREILSEK